jgi:hypothetical protein
MNLTALFSNHPFWGLLTLAVLAWYSTVTVYVAVRGIVDIKNMLRNLRQNRTETGVPRPPATP